MQITPNLGLKIPEGTDIARREDIFDNFQTIDTAYALGGAGGATSVQIDKIYEQFFKLALQGMDIDAMLVEQFDDTSKTDTVRTTCSIAGGKLLVGSQSDVGVTIV